MQILLIAFLCSVIVALIVIPKSKTKKPKKKVDSNNKWKMPNIFWDEFNWLSLKIYSMKYDECEDIQYKINQFIEKYQEFADFNAFNDRVGLLLHDYQKRVQLLINNKHLQNGTSTELK